MAEVGRPTVMTDEVIRKIEEVAALDGSVAEMAYYAGIHPDTIYAHLKENKDFSDRISALRERPILKARQTIVKALDNPDHAFKYLERKRKSEFSSRTELTGADGKSIMVMPSELINKNETNTIPKSDSPGQTQV